jgi:hypothetical protein
MAVSLMLSSVEADFLHSLLIDRLEVLTARSNDSSLSSEECSEVSADMALAKTLFLKLSGVQ